MSHGPARIELEWSSDVRMDCGPALDRLRFDMADRLYNAQIGQCNGMRTLPQLLSPGVEDYLGGAGLRTAMSTRMRMSSLEISALQNFPKECMIETGWYCLSKPVRRCLTKGSWHAEWKSLPYATEDVMDGCMMSASRSHCSGTARSA